MADNLDLFAKSASATTKKVTGRLTGDKSETPSPLADRLRPTRLEDFVGQVEALGEGSFLRQMILADRIPSLVL